MSNSISSLGNVCPSSTRHAVYNHDYEWFESHPDRLCRARKPFPGEAPGYTMVAVIRHPVIGWSNHFLRLQGSGTCNAHLENQLTENFLKISEEDLKALLEEMGVPVEDCERAHRERLAQANKGSA